RRVRPERCRCEVGQRHAVRTDDGGRAFRSASPSRARGRWPEGVLRVYRRPAAMSGGMTMAEKLAVFCDGTWNDLRKPHPTNVVRLAKCVAETSDAGEPQVVYYDSGVGVAANIGWLVDKATKYIGGALGRGLDQKIEDAYRFLVLNFEPDDEIYVFGFS